MRTLRRYIANVVCKCAPDDDSDDDSDDDIAMCWSSHVIMNANQTHGTIGDHVRYGNVDVHFDATFRVTLQFFPQQYYNYGIQQTRTTHMIQIYRHDGIFTITYCDQFSVRKLT